MTTDNSSEMVSGMAMLRYELHTSPSEDSYHLIHVYYLTQVVNMAVKECLTEVHNEVKLIRLSIASIRFSSKRRELFDRVRFEFGESMATLPCLDCERSWSSNFEMIKGACKATRPLNSVMYCVSELSQNVVRYDDREQRVQNLRVSPASC